MAIADYQTLVDQLVRGQSGDELLPADRDSAIELAVQRYSEDCPRKLAEDVTWAVDGHLNPLPALWVDGSVLTSAEYPIGQRPIAYVAMSVYLEPAGLKLMSPEALGAGALVRVGFTRPHELEGGATPKDTIPPRHREPVARYAAYLLCQQLATKYSGDREVSIAADSASTDTRARNFAARARENRQAYFAGIGKADPFASSGGSSGALAGAAAASISSFGQRTRERDLLVAQARVEGGRV